MDTQKRVIGATEYVSIGKYMSIPAKIDTGADASSIWASNIHVDKDGTLRFCLFGKDSPLYTGKIFKRTEFGVARVKSSNGTSQLRYRTHLTINIAGKLVRANLYLADRSTQAFPIIIGRRTISNKFLVDVSKKKIALQKPLRGGLNEELRADPYGFHKKYVADNKELL